MEKKNNLPTLLVIAGTGEEDWINLCSQYSSIFRVIQTTWDRISLTSYSDCKFPTVTIYPNSNPLYPSQEVTINDIKPSLILIRNFPRQIGGKLDLTPDYRNLLYGFYHSNIPMINDIGAIICEIEKPLMYGRLRKIRDKYGEENFPLIKQYYYPSFSEIYITPNTPYVLKVSFPHGGFGKIRVKDNHEIDDLKSILALHKDYCAMEPLIDVDYELRIIFIAPNYYRVHKRKGMSWKVNFGMTSEREDCPMESRWKKWIDLIYQTYPDMLTFDIDALVDKNGKEYILEINGSSQGFAPEHGRQDLIHMRNLVVRKLEVILGKNILEENNEAKKLFNENNDKQKIKLEDGNEKDMEIINLKNSIDDYKMKLNDYKRNYNSALEVIQKYRNEKNSQGGGSIYIPWILIFLSIICLIFSFYFYYNRK